MATATTSKKSEKQDKPKLSDGQQAVLNDVSAAFFARMGWGGDRDEELAKLQQQKEMYEKEVARLGNLIENFDDREEKANDIMTQVVRYFVADGAEVNEASKEVLLNAVAVKLGVVFPPRPRAPKGSVAKLKDELAEKILAVLDHEGMSSVDIKKALNDASIDPMFLSHTLAKMVKDEKIGSDGSGRAKKYFLFAEEETSA